jgi:hypothetical protein
MTRANYRTMPALIANRKPFTHGSAHAYTDTDGTYRVWSYSTEIAVYYSDSAKCEEMFAKGWLTSPNPIWLNDRKYSVTTSRLQNIIRKAWAI